MTIKNTTENYGTIAKCLHWFMAVLILASYCSVYYRHWFTDKDTPENWNALHLHLSVGITIGVLVVLRIIWRLSNPQPRHEPGTALQHLAARSGHYALYALMIVMPITGYLGTGINTEFFLVYEIPGFKETAAFSTLVTDGLGITFKAFEKPIDFIHKDIMGDWLVWILILGHIGFALYHHWFKKDRTLEKMSFRWRRG